MRFLIVLFSLLGIGLHVRMLPIFDTESSPSFAELWSVAAFPNRVWTVLILGIPFVYYTFCAATSFVQRRSLLITLAAVVVFLVTLPVLGEIHKRLPTVANNALLTAMFWVPYYATRPKRRLA